MTPASSRSSKIYFVAPWFPDQPTGGAELQARRTVAHLRSRGLDVEVVTTCVPDFRSDWNVNALPEGPTEVDGIPVRRFPANPRNWLLFDQVNLRMLRGEWPTTAEERIYVEESIRSDGLERFLASADPTSRFVFIPYMFGTTYWGAQIAPERSFLLPCLHDEVYARLGVFRSMFRSVRGVLCNSAAERALALELYDLPPERALLIGEGVDTEVTADAARFRARYGLVDPFVLYVGRKDPGKNIGLLVDYFVRYKVARPGPLKLVLVGAGSMRLPAGGDVVDLGFVPTQDKLDAYAAATVLCQPSLNESFSLVLMEGWLCGAPALVHSDCAVTLDHCRRGNGGLDFRTFDELVAALDWYQAHPAAARRLAACGGEYVRLNFTWERIATRLERVLLGV